LYVDVTVHADKLAEMLILSGGKRQVPVILEDDKVTIGYGGS
jgi:glutaredoxin